MTDNSSLNMKLELIPMPVSDIDRAKDFYVKKVGFHLDHDVSPTADMRIVQLTPPGSSCSIVIGTGMSDITAMKPGSLRALHLVVDDIEKVRQTLVDHDVEVSDIQDMGGMLYAYFADPDGNTWALQHIPTHM